MMDGREGAQEQWHIEKGISPIQILTVVAMVFAIAAGWYDNKQEVALQGQRLAVLERRVEQAASLQGSTDRVQDASLVAFREEIRVLVNRMDDKLDRLLELYISGNRQ